MQTLSDEELSKLSDDELEKLLGSLELQETDFDNRQATLKICLNSCYGVFGQPSFLWYSKEIAEAITLSGQMAIQLAGDSVNTYLTKLLKLEKKKDFVLFTDTDSVGVHMKEIADKYLPKNVTADQAVKFFDKMSKEMINPVFEACFADLCKKSGVKKNFIFMKRETIADQTLFLKKKRYIMNMLDSEGIRFTEPKIKIKGMQAVRSDTPIACREMIKKVIKLLFTEGEESVKKAIEEFRVKFKTLPLDEIAKPSGVSEISKWVGRNGEILKGAPAHVKAAIHYNRLVDAKNLGGQYIHMRDGDKIRYITLVERNPTRNNALAFYDELPVEFEMHKYIDYDGHFERTFMSPIIDMLTARGWKIGGSADLDDLFA